MILYLERDRVKVPFLLKKNSCAVILPEVAEVSFNLTFQIRVNVFPVTIRLIMNLFYEWEPLLEQVVVVPDIFVVLGDQFDELVHDNGKNRHTDQLEHRPDNLLLDRERGHVAISNGSQGCQHEVKALYQPCLRRHDRIILIKRFFALGPSEIVLDDPVPLIRLEEKISIVDEEVWEAVPDQPEEVGRDEDGDDLVEGLHAGGDLSAFDDLLISTLRLKNVHDQFDYAFIWNKVTCILNS